MVETENLGHYEVNGRAYKNKLAAIAEANKTLADITWLFNDQVFNALDWTKEPTETLDELYKRRAKYIREKYDYVVMMFSGGADSVGMLHAFVDNGIRIDEIIASAPFSGMNNWRLNQQDLSAANMVSETWLAQLPKLEEVHKAHPHIKITLNDYFPEMLALTDEWLYNQTGHWIHYSSTARHDLNKFKHLKDMAENGKRIAICYGIDKPQLCRSPSGNIYSVVLDSTVNIVTPHFKERYDNAQSVLFFYNAAVPQLMVKQAHLICKQMFLPHNRHIRNNLWDQSRSAEFNLNPKRINGWEKAIVPIIYDGAVNNHGMLWQASKQQLGFRGGFQIDGWVYKLHPNSRMVQMVESELVKFVKPINRKYLASDNPMDGFVRYAKYWKIGHESQWQPQPQHILDHA